MDDVTYFSNANVGSVLIIPHAIFSAIATLFVGLRLYTARYVTKNEWCTDEYVSIIALVANHIMLISEGICWSPVPLLPAFVVERRSLFLAAVSLGLGSNIVKIQTEFPGGLSSFLKVRVDLPRALDLPFP
ncbi:hypothetical protein BFJ66_g18013 [Fusarium oxysporum f. sp. cepae]|nr:hypothetical protein BFJ66_g18013 [Fusarium oxysporum f. sp. cepae]